MENLTRAGLNIDSKHPGDRQRAIDTACDMNAAGHLILDDYLNRYNYCWQLKNRSANAKRVHRRYMDKRDGDLHQADNGDSPTGKLLGRQFAQFLKNMQNEYGAPPGTMEQVFCEPNVHGEELIFKNNWLIDCIEEADRLGLELVVDNPQEVNILQSEVDRGYYDALMRTLAKYPKMRYGIHGYWLGAAMGNISNAAIAKLGIPGSFPYASWRVDTPERVTAQRAAFVQNWRENQLCMGTMALVRRCVDVLKIPPPKFIKTEYGPDLVRLFKEGEITAQVKQLNGGVDPMGYPTMGTYWDQMFKAEKWTKPQALIEQVKYCDAVEMPEVEFFCMFGLDTSYENGRYHLG